MNRNRAAFTLIELLVVVAVLGILIGLVALLAPGVIMRGNETKSLNNMRQVGAGFQLYANDNDFFLPSRVQSGDKWPALLLAGYMDDPKVLADPGDPDNFLIKKTDPRSNGRNNTSYIMNGYNDIGAYGDEKVAVKVNSLDKPSATILLANQSNSGNFYMDTAEGNQNSGVLRKNVFDGGANYLFADGSVHFIKAKDLTDDLWYVHKDADRTP
jgi:prepilin-type N-terminal cleavage/methylation domain-containing protein/prepilin-type processing-associated H-X9-DG protein